MRRRVLTNISFPGLVALKFIHSAVAGPTGPLLEGEALLEQIRLDRSRNLGHLSWVSDRGVAGCNCPEEAETTRETVVAAVRHGFLEGPHQMVHSICEDSKHHLHENMDSSTWGRPKWRTSCEPQLVTLLVFCAVSAAAQRQVEQAIPYYIAALVTLHLSVLACYDQSGWPFLVDDIVENFVRLIEDGENFQWVTPQRPFRISGIRRSEAILSDRNPADKSNDVNLLEQAMILRQAMGIYDTMINLIGPKVIPGGPRQHKRFEVIHENGPDWADWTFEDICRHARELFEERISREQSSPTVGVAVDEATESTFGPPKRLVRVLNAFAGMFAPPRELHCNELPSSDSGSGYSAKIRLEITSVDRYARAYLATLSRHGWSPRHGVPQRCDVEELWRCLPRGMFDMVHVRNGLDHTVRPLRAIKELVRAVRPGGRVILRHWRNEHPEAWKGLISGPHQWGFCLCPSNDAAAASGCAAAGWTPGGTTFPVLWNYAVSYNLTKELAGMATVLSARYETDTASKDGGGNKYVVMEFQRLIA